MSERARTSRRRFLLRAGLAAGVPVFATGLWQTDVLEVTRHRRVLAGYRGEPFRVVQLSDLHRGPLVTAGMIGRAVHAALGERPDLVLVTGDFVSRSAGYAASCAEELARLRPPLGMWGVLGNHDYWTTEAAKVENAMCGAGCEIVTNRSVRLRNGVRVAGIDDRMAGAPDMRLAFGAVKKDEPLLAMAHNPLSFRDTTDIPMTMFAGHTHGGQVLFPGRSGFLERKYGYVAGWYSRGRSTLYVNRGIGTVIVPFRLFARPEVSVFDFLPENEA